VLTADLQPNRQLAKWQKKWFPHFENWAIIVGDTQADGRDIVLPGGLDASFDVDDVSEVDQPVSSTAFRPADHTG
jgi:hypothetical protein